MGDVFWKSSDACTERVFQGLAPGFMDYSCRGHEQDSASIEGAPQTGRSTPTHSRSNRQLAMLLPNLRGDGAVRMMLLLAKGFVQRGYNVDILAVKSEGELLARVPAGVNLVELRANGTLSAVPRISRYLRKKNPLALFATEFYSGLPAMYANLLSMTRTPVFIRQDNTWSKDKARLRGRHRWLIPIAVRLLFPKATVIAVSKGVAEDLATTIRFDKQRLQVIYNPALTSDVEQLARQNVDHPWLSEKGPPVILAVGRLAQAKGFDILIRAFSKVVQRQPARLLILGEGPERTRLEALVSCLGLHTVCQLPGFKENPYCYMARAAVFALPSRWEGLPTVLIEALALRTPVVATDCPHGPKEILANGQFGRLVPPDDPDALTDALMKALDRPKLADGSLNYWLEQFAEQKSIAQHLRLIELLRDRI